MNASFTLATAHPPNRIAYCNVTTSTPCARRLEVVESSGMKTRWSGWVKVQLLAVVLFIALIASLFYFWHRAPSARSREIATALIEMRHCWQTNGYRGQGMTVPKTLDSSSKHAWSAGILGAYVSDEKHFLGMNWSKRYHILRANTNSTVWTLYEIRSLDKPDIRWISSKRELVTITNTP